MSEVIQPPAWMADGLCAQIDNDLFFPDKGDPVHLAKAMCHRCPVIEQCAQYALDRYERFGVWGGLSAQDRRKIWQQRAVEGAA